VQAPGSDHQIHAEARENGRQREIAPQALCLRLLRKAKKYHTISIFCAKPSNVVLQTIVEYRLKIKSDL
jgi:muconolactone delta-isomerase